MGVWASDYRCDMISGINTIVLCHNEYLVFLSEADYMNNDLRSVCQREKVFSVPRNTSRTQVVLRSQIFPHWY